MTTVIVYSKAQCPYCVAAKRLLNAKGVEYQEIMIDQDPSQRDIMIARSGRRTVPQIFINDEAIGGYDDMAALEKAGKLNALLGL